MVHMGSLGPFRVRHPLGPQGSGDPLRSHGRHQARHRHERHHSRLAPRLDRGGTSAVPERDVTVGWKQKCNSMCRCDEVKSRCAATTAESRERERESSWASFVFSRNGTAGALVLDRVFHRQGFSIKSMCGTLCHVFV